MTFRTVSTTFAHYIACAGWSPSKSATPGHSRLHLAHKVSEKTFVSFVTQDLKIVAIVTYLVCYSTVDVRVDFGVGSVLEVRGAYDLKERGSRQA